MTEQTLNECDKLGNGIICEQLAELQKQHEEMVKEINLENGQLETDIDKLRQENQQLKEKITQFGRKVK